MEKRYNFRIYPTKAQEVQIQKNFGCCRFVYNYYLAKRIEAYRNGQGILSLNKSCRDLTILKKSEEYKWLHDADDNSLRNSIRELDLAYKAFFRKVKSGDTAPGHPKFKSKRETRQSYKSKNNIVRRSVDIDGKVIKLPKLGLVDCRVSRQIEGRILSATVSQMPSGKYHVSVCCTDYEPQPLPKTGADVGVHMGIRNLATTSDGKQFNNLRSLEKAGKKIARLQRQVSRKTKDGKNREKARIRLARAYEKAVNQKTDATQKITTQLVSEYDVICVRSEKLIEIRKNPIFAKYMADAAWGEFTRQLSYKCGWYGKHLVKISNWHPSAQLCSFCGSKNKEVNKKKFLKEWGCSNCGAHHNRAINAAKNILVEGMQHADEVRSGRPEFTPMENVLNDLRCGVR